MLHMSLMEWSASLLNFIMMTSMLWFYLVMADNSLTEPNTLRYYSIYMRQKIDIGDLVEYDKYQALVLDRKTINPNYNTERVFHPDEYHCKVLLLNSDNDNDYRWVRTKWLKLLSKSS
tara:strand:+ start:737 stop:1090 length:354 start_codon:yes stop_codon:yes gene_type:complete